jgi:LmbE family N-acetylglucosaminyl deacetylase
MDILCIGAHPDDCEVSIGGTATLYRDAGHHVGFVSVTNGCKGHYADEYRRDNQALVSRRREESLAAAAVIGAASYCLEIPDGEVYVTQEATESMVRLIRNFGEPGRGPDLVLLNRPNDYHRDHRYSARLVLDATFMLTVPLMCPDTRHLDRMPVFAYWQDGFSQDGGAFVPDVVVPIDSVVGQKHEMVAEHVSQFYEWLPYNMGVLDDVPTHPMARYAWLGEWMKHRDAGWRTRFEPQLLAAGHPAETKYVEAFVVSEYGRQPNPGELKELFPAQP